MGFSVVVFVVVSVELGDGKAGQAGQHLKRLRAKKAAPGMPSLKLPVWPI
jgi:hypothetical protein